MLRIASWNVNSVRQRIGHLTDWLARVEPDVVCLQELKCQDEQFPGADIEALGYNIAVHGQKGFNGVAILSRLPLEEVKPRLPGNDEDAQSRYLEAVVSTKEGVVRVASIYLPNGNPVDSEKYPYKLAWMDRLIRHARDGPHGPGAARAHHAVRDRDRRGLGGNGHQGGGHAC